MPKIPDILSSVGALMWSQGSWPRKVAILLLGIAASNYGTADFTAFAGISEGLAGFVVGLFSRAAAVWCFRAWDQFALGSLLNEWVRKRLGLSPKSGMSKLQHLTLTAINPALALLPPAMDSLQARVMLMAIGLQESRLEHR